MLDLESPALPGSEESHEAGSPAGDNRQSFLSMLGDRTKDVKPDSASGY